MTETILLIGFIFGVLGLFWATIFSLLYMQEVNGGWREWIKFELCNFFWWISIPLLTWLCIAVNSAPKIPLEVSKPTIELIDGMQYIRTVNASSGEPDFVNLTRELGKVVKEVQVTRYKEVYSKGLYIQFSNKIEILE